MNRRDRRRAKEQRAVSTIEDVHGKPLKVALAIKGRLIFSDPPPHDVLMPLIEDLLRSHPNGLAEKITQFDNRRQIFFIIGPRDGNTVEVDVWERYDAQRMFESTGHVFFEGNAPPRAAAPKGSVYPVFMFDRHCEIERESNLILAGNFILDSDLPETPEAWSPEQRELVTSIHLQLVMAARSDVMPKDSIVYGWSDGVKPANAVDVDDRGLMDAWAAERTWMIVRVTAESAEAFLRQPDSTTLQALGMLKRH